jgi:hypothetical protein
VTVTVVLFLFHIFLCSLGLSSFSALDQNFYIPLVGHLLIPIRLNCKYGEVLSTSYEDILQGAWINPDLIMASSHVFFY